MAHMHKVLVAEATGYLGSYVAQEFMRRGCLVKVLARAPEKLQSVGPYKEPAIDQLCDDLVVGEVTRPETLKGVKTMNCFIGHTVTKQERDAKPVRNLHVSTGSVNQKNRMNTTVKNPLRRASLMLEILESAHIFFQQKGFEKTGIEDICNRLNINSAQFYYHFESLDEVLETLWAR